MPVLTAEPALYPESLFTDEACLSPDGGWYVMHTKPRQEKSLARQLLAKQVPFYLPLVAQRTKLATRVIVSHMPLFGGYAFVHADRDQRIAALDTKRIVKALEVADQGGLWNDLKQIFQLIATGAPIMPVDRLGPGSQVVVKSGVFKGMTGTILRHAGGRRFLVQVNFIQRGAAVELEDYVLTEAV